MRRKRLLSFEAKFILLAILIVALFFIPLDYSKYFLIAKGEIIDFYHKHIAIYPLWIQLSPLSLPFIIYLIVLLSRINRCDYKKDFIYGVKWKWEWYGKNIVDLKCYCPNCNEELYYDINNSNDQNLTIGKFDFICDKCDKVVSSIPNSNSTSRSAQNIKIEIERVIKKRLAKK